MRLISFLTCGFVCFGMLFGGVVTVLDVLLVC